MKEVGERLESNISVATVHHNFCSAAVEESRVPLSGIGRDPVNSRQSIKPLGEKAWRATSDPKILELGILVLCALEGWCFNRCPTADGDGERGPVTGEETDCGRWRTGMDPSSLGGEK